MTFFRKIKYILGILPDKPSELLSLALSDLERYEGRTFTTLGGLLTGRIAPQSGSPKQEAVANLATGFFCVAFNYLNLELPSGMQSFYPAPKYEDDHEYFKLYIKKLIAYLERKGC